MVDTSSVDLLHIIPGTYKKVSSSKGGEYHGACPFCGGDDRFIIQPHLDTPRWWCRKCDKKGDAIEFKMQYDGLPFVEAVQSLHLESQLKPSNNNQPKPKQAIAPGPESIHALDNPEWQEKAMKFMEWSWDNLHSGNYGWVNDYLYHRGFDEHHTDIWRLGYNPENYHRTWGGVEVYIPQGLVIPWLDGRQEYVYKVNIRREANNNPKYLQIKGGANWLFNSHRVRADSIVILVEGELDAISINIAWNHHRIVPVATGSSTGARWLRWAGLLSSAYRVLIAFDDDDAGEIATKWWAQYLPNARRLLPESKDCNEMLTENYPFKLWIQKGLAS